MPIMNELAAKLIEILPRIRTKIQLTGLAVAIVGFLLIRVASPTALSAQLTLGSIGIVLIVFAQVFHFLKDFPAKSRLTLVLALFFGFLFFSGLMLWLTLFLLGDAKRNIATYELRSRSIDVSPLSFLHHVREGNPKTIQLFLSAGFSPDQSLPGEDAPLVIASRLKNPDALSALLTSGAYVNVESNGTTPLLAAVESKQLQNVLLLLKNGADPNRSGSQPCRTPLSLSVENTEMLTTLVRQGARIDLSSGCSPILVAVARSGSPEAIDILVRKGARVDQAGNDGKTPLIAASGNNLPKREARVDNLRVLLERNANPNLRDKDGCTALLYAVSSGSLEATRLLLAANADPNLYDDGGFGPLMVATQQKERIDIMKALLDAGANPNARTLEAGLTPLHHSLRSSAPYCAKAILLLKAGADIQAKDNKGRRPLSNLPPKGVELACDEIRKLGGSYLCAPRDARKRAPLSSDVESRQSDLISSFEQRCPLRPIIGQLYALETRHFV